MFTLHHYTKYSTRTATYVWRNLLGFRFEYAQTACVLFNSHVRHRPLVRRSHSDDDYTTRVEWRATHSLFGVTGCVCACVCSRECVYTIKKTTHARTHARSFQLGRPRGRWQEALAVEHFRIVCVRSGEYTVLYIRFFEEFLRYDFNITQPEKHDMLLCVCSCLCVAMMIFINECCTCAATPLVVALLLLIVVAVCRTLPGGHFTGNMFIGCAAQQHKTVGGVRCGKRSPRRSWEGAQETGMFRFLVPEPRTSTDIKHDNLKRVYVVHNGIISD